MAHIRISRTFLLVAVVALLMLLAPATAAARVGFGFGFYGPVYPFGYWGGYPYYGGYYGPYGYGPYGYGPYGYGPYGYGGPYGGLYGYGPYGYRPMGEVKIKSPNPDAEIYINGSLAGRAHEVKHIHLRPGSYRIEQRIGDDVQKTRVYVLADRTVKVEFGPVGGQPVGPPPPPPEDRNRENP